MQFRTDDHGWIWVPVEWLLNNLTYSDDFGDVSGYESRAHFWGTMMESKALDGGFLDIVDSIMTHGWREALTAIIHDYGDGPEAHISNGHHRLVAAILLCEEEVPLWNHSQPGKMRADGCPTARTRFGIGYDDTGILLEVL
jgi:hypothetical protein